MTAPHLVAPHGTRIRYSTYGCRCRECTTANGEYNRELRRELRAQPKDPNDPRHGKLSFHNAHGCRCDKCVTAYNDYMRGYMRTRKRQRPNDRPDPLDANGRANP